MKKKKTLLPLLPVMCGTCPFRPGSKYACLASDLQRNALNEGSRICHSTGRNGLSGRTGKPSMLCRGARDIQLQVFHALGVITEPTDEAWADACNQLGFQQPQNPRQPCLKRATNK